MGDSLEATVFLKCLFLDPSASQVPSSVRDDKLVNKGMAVRNGTAVRPNHGCNSRLS